MPVTPALFDALKAAKDARAAAEAQHDAALTAIAAELQPGEIRVIGEAPVPAIIKDRETGRAQVVSIQPLVEG